MDITLEQNSFDLKIAAIIQSAKLLNIEQIFTDMFEHMPTPPAFNYIGNLNKSDSMF